MDYRYRNAQIEDVPKLRQLMEDSIEENMRGILSPQEIIAAKETMGVDTSLISDQTYFIIFHKDDVDTFIGCGGWGKRKTLYGGDSINNRDDSFCDPIQDAARVRAMYTHPKWVRKGVASYLLELAEEHARKAGFSRLELGSTVAGEAFYLSKGYIPTERIEEMASNGKIKTVTKMYKQI